MTADATARLHLYYGPDDFRLREAYQHLRRQLDRDGLEADITTLPARGLQPQELIQHAATVPFLAETRMVVVEGLLLALGSGRTVIHDWQPLIDAIPQLPPTNHVVLLEPFTSRDARRDAQVFSRSPLVGALRGLDDVDVREFQPLRLYARRDEAESEVAAWVRERAATSSVEIERAAIEVLVDLVGADLWALAAEVEKLGQYAGGRAISVEDVRQLTPEARAAGIFDLVDAVVEGHAARALLLLRKMLELGTESPGHIQLMIARQLRHLVRATELIEGGADQRAVGEATGVRNDFALRKLMRQARSTSRPAAEAALREVEASDHAVKTGRLDETLALELLVMRLATPARQPAAT